MARRRISLWFLSAAATVLGGCQSAQTSKDAALSGEAMRSSCVERVAGMYGVAAGKVALPPSFDAADGGGRLLNGKVDKGPEGAKEFRCIFSGSGELVDVMAMTPDGE